ncbi:MAG: hypothetical protein FJ317_05340 [SAR202 cluster bacterium]|nr:hypothetical protein [SAR202 cluster bacterium]
MVLTIFVEASGLLIELVHSWGDRHRPVEMPETEMEATERADRALAAVIAVGALLADPGRATRSGVQAGNNPP